MKIFYHWGLESEMRKMTIKLDAIGMHLCTADLSYLPNVLIPSPLGHSGELLGLHEWDEEMLKEARGDYCGLWVRVPRSPLLVTPSLTRLSRPFIASGSPNVLVRHCTRIWREDTDGLDGEGH